MFTAKYEGIFLFILRWLARSLGMTSITILLLFLFGEEGSFSSITPNQAVGLFFFPFGLIVGLILSWWQEIYGGAITVVSILGFYFIYELLINGSWPRSWWFAIFATPGALFLLYGILALARNPGRHERPVCNESWTGGS